MATTTCTIVGVFDDTATAERVAQELTQQGVSRDRIQVTSSDSYTSDYVGGNTGLTGERPRDTSGGGIAGFFERLFGSDVNEAERGHYTEAVHGGRTVVAVTTDNADEDRVTSIMERYNPVDIDVNRQGREPGYMTGEGRAERREIDRTNSPEQASIPVVEEHLNVGKRAVQRGGVRVYRQMSEQPVEEQVRLREEHVRVDRHPADRPATEADFRPGERVIEVREMAEEPMIVKEARVVEEVVVGKETRERTETVRDSVRRSDVQVENLGAGETGTRSGLTTDYGDDFRRDFGTRYGSDRSATYETYAPAYEYGYRMAGDQRYRGRSWDDVESTLRTDYERNNPNSAWDRAKGAVRYGWEKVTGKR